ncbi:MAG TPA: PAS domain-containing protein [Anaerolineales bacterium]|nr:PAS domain-containing protein [Anaerolineales bacterium]
MPVPLHVLIIEDSADDAQLMVRTIERGGYDVQHQRVETQADLQEALAHHEWDLILCDYTLPGFDAIAALETVKGSGKDVPFIIVSGSIGEEMAIAALRSGAHDFMLKGNLARLLPAIRRERNEAATRRERGQAEQQVRKTVKFLDTLIDTANVIYVQLDLQGRVVKVNSAAEEITGYSRAELEGHSWAQKVLPRDRYPQPWREFDRITRGGQKPGTFENPILRKDGEERYILWKHNVVREDDRMVGVISFGVDITDRKRAEAALREAEARYRLLVEHMPAITYVIAPTPPYQTLYISPHVEQLLGFHPDEWYADPDLWQERLHPDDRQRVLEEDRLSRAEKRAFVAEYRILARDGRVVWLHDETHHIAEPGLPPFSQGIEFDISQRMQAEHALRDAEASYRSLVEQLPMVVYVNPAGDAGHTVYVSPQVEAVFGYTPREWLADPSFWLTTVHPDDRARVLAEVERVNASGTPFDMEYRMLARDGRLLWIRDQGVRVNDTLGHPFRWQGLMIDVTDARRREREWEAVARLSNALRETPTVRDILPRLLDETLDFMDAGQGSIWLRDAATNEVRLAVQRNWGEGEINPYAPDSSIPQIVIETGQSILAPEQPAEASSGRGAACVPLAAAGLTLGALCVDIPAQHDVAGDEARVLAALADLGAYAIHRAQLFDETARHLDRLAALRSIDIAISSSFDLKMILNVVVDKAITELQVDAADIQLLKPDALVLEFAAGKGFWTHNMESDLLAVGDGLPGRAVLERNILHIEDLGSAGQDFVRPYLTAEEGFVAYYGIPLVAKGKVKGILELFHRSPLARDGEWMQFLEALAGQTAIAIDSSSTFQDLQRSNMELAMAYDATIEGWSRALDLRDRETEGHTQRVTSAAIKLAHAMGMSDEALLHLRRGALLHDIGKMGVPDSVLLKPGALTDAESLIMHQHPKLAYEMLAPIEYLKPALDIPYAHHERWDGSGYPRGLKGTEIPLAARIFAVVDVWDALSNDRPYRPAWRREDVVSYLREQSGRQFDPAVVSAFIDLLKLEELDTPPGYRP